MIFWVLLIAAVVFGVFRVIRWRKGGCCGVPYAESGSNKAKDIARERYASGEISEEEFKKITKTLS